MPEDPSFKIKASIRESINLKEIVLEKELHNVLVEMGELIVTSILSGGKILICGNGGSAADAQHLVAEFLIRLTSEVNREGIPAICLLQDSSTFTASVNDFEPKYLFQRNLQTLANKEDILLAISTSGNSENIVEVLKTANERQIKTLGFLGSGGGKSLEHCNLSIIVPSIKTARIQEVHIMLGHILVEYVEDSLLREGFLSLD